RRSLLPFHFLDARHRFHHAPLLHAQREPDIALARRPETHPGCAYNPHLIQKLGGSLRGAKSFRRASPDIERGGGFWHDPASLCHGVDELIAATLIERAHLLYKSLGCGLSKRPNRRPLNPLG